MFKSIKAMGGKSPREESSSGSSLSGLRVEVTPASGLSDSMRRKRLMLKNLGLIAMPGGRVGPAGSAHRGSWFSLKSGAGMVVEEGLGTGWSKVRKNLPAVIEYGVREGILQPKPKQESKEEQHDLEDEEAQRKQQDVVQIEINDISLIHEAIPFLPLPIAVFCLLLNLVAPGTGEEGGVEMGGRREDKQRGGAGTALSGVAGLCLGQPRVQLKDGRRLVTLVVNLCVGVAQLMTVTFFFVGWGWSIAWGGLLLTHALQYREALMQRRQEAVATAAIEALTKDSVLHSIGGGARKVCACRKDVKNLVKGKERRKRRRPDDDVEAQH